MQLFEHWRGRLNLLDGTSRHAGSPDSGSIALRQLGH